MGGDTTDTGDVDASEDRSLFERGPETSTLFVASEPGLASIDVAGDRIGTFELAIDRPANCVAAADNLVAVGTPDDVLVDDGGGAGFTSLLPGATEGSIPSTGGTDAPVCAIGVDGTRVVFATDDGAVFVCETARDPPSWHHAGTVRDPRRADGRLVATASGVAAVGTDVQHLGLADVRDVTQGAPVDGEANSGGVAYAATAAGIHRFVDGDWVKEHDLPASVVAGTAGRVFAVDESGILERTGDGWEYRESPPVVPVDLAAGETLSGVTADGTVLLAADAAQTSDGHRGWRTQALGLSGVAGVAVRGHSDRSVDAVR